MKFSSSTSATLKFSSPEIRVGLDAVNAPKKKSISAPAPKMPKNKKMIMPGEPDPKSRVRKDKNPAKRIPKRKK
jgi:hypothetical protein